MVVVYNGAMVGALVGCAVLVLLLLLVCALSLRGKRRITERQTTQQASEPDLQKTHRQDEHEPDDTVLGKSELKGHPGQPDKLSVGSQQNSPERGNQNSTHVEPVYSSLEKQDAQKDGDAVLGTSGANENEDVESVEPVYSTLATEISDDAPNSTFDPYSVADVTGNSTDTYTMADKEIQGSESACNDTTKATDEGENEYDRLQLQTRPRKATDSVYDTIAKQQE